MRTALSLSMITGRPFRLTRIRAKRGNPGLLRQHLAAVRAATAMCGARVEGAEAGSMNLLFHPGEIRPGTYHVPIGTAGSTSLVVQTVLPAMLQASGPSVITVEGGTHNLSSPPVEFLQHAFLPLLRSMGADVDLVLERAGFYPAGGGRVVLSVRPLTAWTPLKLMARGGITRRRAVAVMADLGASIASRELREVQRRLEFRDQDLETVHLTGTACPGNVLQLYFESKHVTEVFTGFGRLGAPAKQVADEVCREARTYLAVDVPVGRHLADQLLIPLALAGSGRFRTLRPTAHTLTNIEVIQQFYPVRFQLEKHADGIVDIQLTHNGDET